MELRALRYLVLMRFTRSEGAGAHCQVGAKRLTYARIHDWLDETLSWSVERIVRRGYDG